MNAPHSWLVEVYILAVIDCVGAVSDVARKSPRVICQICFFPDSSAHSRS